MSDEPKKDSNMWMHHPLPYVIRARVMVSDDTPQEQHMLHKIYAYSIIEAMFQACILLGGTGMEDAKIKIDAIGPDLDELTRCVRDSILQAAATKE